MLRLCYSCGFLILFLHWMGHLFCFFLLFFCFLRGCHVLILFRSLNKLLMYQSIFLWSRIFWVVYLPAGDNLCSIFQSFSHTLCPLAQICSFSWANSVSPSHLLLFFSLSTPLILFGFSYNVRSHHIQTFPLSPLVSLLCFFLSVSIQLSAFQDAHIFLLSSAFLFFSPWTDLSLSMCAALYVLSFDNPLEPLSPVKSWLECSLPVSEDFAEG